MALQNMQITAITAMRARDVSRPSQENHDFAERRPLRDESGKKDRKGERPERTPPRASPRG
ncbi:hypothetical protein SAMN05421505_103156 [Sinosporangium album]|uniref:Uncharacterized protein n=1 Tax=Sinosporangium album TaxID=504805 RepID=A0A1G7T8F5_9ACTN|nr:hypothetical protein [Sinosporangium album]SDG31558.1 hypothetical protein SAMN05421505_103156 [Sinosporangium album]